MMIYHSILFSFCLMGMASAIDLCSTTDGGLQATCNKTSDAKSCTIKAEGAITKESDKECRLILTSAELKDKGAFKITCNVGDKATEKAVDKDRSKIAACSAGSVPQFAGVTLLLALLTPLLSGVL